MTVVIILDSFLSNCPVVDSFLSFVFDWLCILSVSLQFLFNRGLFLLIAGFKLKNSLAIEWQSPQLRIPETNYSFSENWQNSCLSSEYLIKLFPLFCLLISSSLSLMLSCTIPLGSTSASLEFLHSLIVPHYAYCISLWPSPKHNTRRRSLSMLVLSHSDTHYFKGHMACCGCHERSDQSRSSQEYMPWCGCPEILIALCFSPEFFLADQ